MKPQGGHTLCQEKWAESKEIVNVAINVDNSEHAKRYAN
jgi:hypothetical protein